MGAKNLRRLALVNNDKIRESLTEHWWRTMVCGLISQTWNNAKKSDSHEHQLRVHFVSAVTLERIISNVKECRSYV